MYYFAGHDVKDFGDLDHFVVEENDTRLPAHLCDPLNNIAYGKKVRTQWQIVFP